MIPCKECLVLPACKNKSEVKCQLLYEWMSTANYRYSISTKYLPKWKRIKADNDFIIFNTWSSSKMGGKE